MVNREIFIAGGTGYVGQRLIPELLSRGHNVRALTRKGSEGRLPAGCTPVIGNALDKSTFASQVRPGDTYVQLVGVAHPSPSKASQFRSIDLVSARESISAAVEAGAGHFVYVSVAHPAPAMKAYIEVRSEVEDMIRASGLKATIVRPWYVLGPGHRWPYLLIPTYWLMERIPKTRETARRLGLVTIEEMANALLRSIEVPPPGVRTVEVTEIRQLARKL
ncbi:MAG TPA: NAD(P)H-binding protein [Blastocatellia bacterium]|nr:NAD(P)H-binding protein [Blastocatellia bacterium]